MKGKKVPSTKYQVSSKVSRIGTLGHLGFVTCYLLLATSSGLAEETGQVMSLGGAGVAITGRGDAYISNPAHLGGLDRWSLATGFAAGSVSDSRPGLSSDSRPSSFWASLSEAALIAPLPGGIGVAGFSTHLGEGKSFRAAYDRMPVFSDFQNTGLMTDARSSLWFRGIAAGSRLGLNGAAGLAMGLLEIKGSSYFAYEEYAPHKYGQGFITEISKTAEETAKGTAFGIVLGGKYRLRKNLNFGGVLSFVTPTKLKETYSSYTYRKTVPNYPLYPDLDQALEGNTTIKIKPPLQVILGAEGKPLDNLRFLFQGRVSLASEAGRLSWVERDEAGVPTLHGIPWTAAKSMTAQVSLGAEYSARRWGFRLGFRTQPSGAPRITEDLEAQDERLDLRAATLGLGFKNPFLIFDMAYAYGWGHGDTKSVTYAPYPAPENEVQSVTLIPIYRRETHSILMTVSYIF